MGGKTDPRVQAIWKKHRQETMTGREALRKAQKAVKNAMLQEPFEAQVLEQALAEVSRQSRESQNQAQSALAGLAAQLSPEERARLKKLRGPELRRNRK